MLPPLRKEIAMQSFTFYARTVGGSTSLSNTVGLRSELAISNHFTQARHARPRE